MSAPDESVETPLLDLEHDVVDGEIVDEALEIVGRLPEPEQKILRRVVLKQTWGYAIPPPEVLARYDPAVQETFLDEWKKAGEHGRRMDRTVMGHQRRGQWIGAGLALVCVVAAFVLGLAGHEWLGGVLGGSTVVALATVFVIGRLTDAESDL